MAGVLLAITCEKLHQVIHPDADQGDDEDRGEEIEPANRDRGVAKRPAQSDRQRHLRGQREPDRTQHHDQTNEDGDQSHDFRTPGITIGDLVFVCIEHGPTCEADGKLGIGLSRFRDSPTDLGNDVLASGDRGEILTLENFDQQQIASEIGLIRDVVVPEGLWIGRPEFGILSTDLQ